MIEVSDKDILFIRNIKEWRKSLLDGIARYLSNEGEYAMQKKQASIGLWSHGDQLPYPSMKDIKITDDESLTFSVLIGNNTIIFSIWIMTGEIRIGVQVPNVVVQNNLLKNKLSEAYDGKPCHRINKKANQTLFDWIWQDREFATYSNMIDALTSHEHTAIIIDRIRQITLHLYLAITNEIIESHHLITSNGVISNEEYENYLISFLYDKETFCWVIKNKLNGIIKELQEKKDENGFVYFVASFLLRKGTKVAMIDNKSIVRDQDGCYFQVIQLSKCDQ